MSEPKDSPTWDAVRQHFDYDQQDSPGAMLMALCLLTDEVVALRETINRRGLSGLLKEFRAAMSDDPGILDDEQLYALSERLTREIKADLEGQARRPPMSVKTT